MTGDPQQPDNPLFPTPPRQRKTPQQVAQTVGDHTRAGLKMLGWGVLGAAGLAAAYVCIRGLIWAVKLIQTAMGC